MNITKSSRQIGDEPTGSSGMRQMLLRKKTEILERQAQELDLAANHEDETSTSGQAAAATAADGRHGQNIRSTSSINAPNSEYSQESAALHGVNAVGARTSGHFIPMLLQNVDKEVGEIERAGPGAELGEKRQKELLTRLSTVDKELRGLEARCRAHETFVGGGRKSAAEQKMERFRMLTFVNEHRAQVELLGGKLRRLRDDKDMRARLAALKKQRLAQEEARLAHQRELREAEERRRRSLQHKSVTTRRSDGPAAKRRPARGLNESRRSQETTAAAVMGLMTTRQSAAWTANRRRTCSRPDRRSERAWVCTAAAWAPALARS